MGAPGPAGVTPWYERSARLCGEQASQAVGCSYSAYSTLQCSIQQDEKGIPNRTCRRLLKKFRDCGRGQEEIETEAEELTDQNFRGSPEDLQDPDRPLRSGQAEAAPNAVLRSTVGDVLEEFLQFSEDLKGRTAENLKEPGLGQRDGQRVDERWYNGLFGGRAHCSPGPYCPDAKTWEGFARDFQDV